ncbi:prepilin-type N-terminal cleavage/methylation domain-containing protein, partial [Acinetobacter baumannii]
MPISRGMTILELLVVLAILGVLLALGAGNLRPDR